MTFAEQLDKAIENTLLSDAEVSRQIGVPYRTLESWRLGNRVPPEYVQRAVLLWVSELHRFKK